MSHGSRVFISYGREDAQEARRVYEALRQAGFDPWLDSEHLLPGQRWQSEIARAIRGADYFIAVLSSRTVSRRGFVQRELKAALDVLKELPESKIFLIPVRLDECTPDHDALRDLHWVDLFPSFDDGLRRVLAAVAPGAPSAYASVAALAEVFGTRWVGGGAAAIVEVVTSTEPPDPEIPPSDPRWWRRLRERGQEYRLALILRNPSPREICSFLGSACAVFFQLQTIAGIPWAALDAVSATVMGYRPLPHYEPLLIAPFQQVNVFYIEIEDPVTAGRNQFDGRYVHSDDGPEVPGMVRLMSGVPEGFVVRLNARTPGIYTFDISVTLSYKDSRQTLSIVQSEAIVFTTLDDVSRIWDEVPRGPTGMPL